MKALENIKWLEDVFVTRKEENNFEVNILIKDAFREAIAELESLNSNDNKVKTCEGCKFGKFGIDSLGVEVECSLLWDCSRGRKDEWEPK